MLLPVEVAEGVRAGTITLAFRRWSHRRVTPGGTQLTSAGVLRFEAVEEVRDLGEVTDQDARAAGFPDVAALRRRLDPSRPAGRGSRAAAAGDRVFRVRLCWVGEDPRIELREQMPGGGDLIALTAAVARLDAGRRTGAWTRPILEWIRDHPGVVSTVLAERLGRELAPVKADIRRLKALGLTESLPVGYRLSPRGLAYLESLE